MAGGASMLCIYTLFEVIWFFFFWKVCVNWNTSGITIQNKEEVNCDYDYQFGSAVYASAFGFVIWYRGPFPALNTVKKNSQL